MSGGVLSCHLLGSTKKLFERRGRYVFLCNDTVDGGGGGKIKAHV